MRKPVILVLMGFLLSVLFVMPARADFSAIGRIYNVGGVSGDAYYPSNYGTGNLFRRDVSAQRRRISSTEGATFSKSNETLPTRFNVKVGLGGGDAWTNITAGNVAFQVFEVIRGSNSYAGDIDYVGAASHILTSTDIINQSFTYPNIHIQPVPTPEARTLTRDSIVICWPSIRTVDDRGNRINMVETYAVYRSEHPSGPFEWLSDVPHKDGGMTYADSRISKGATYYYKLKLRYSWPANRPPYYETGASSNISKGVSVR